MLKRFINPVERIKWREGVMKSDPYWDQSSYIIAVGTRFIASTAQFIARGRYDVRFFKSPEA